MPPKGRYTKPGKAGRSIEEVMVQRRLNGNDPTSWPALGGDTNLRSLSASLPNLNYHEEDDQSAMSMSSAERVVWSREQERVRTMEMAAESVEPLKEYCRELQGKVSSLQFQLGGTVKIMQKELKKTREKAAESLEVQKLMMAKDMDTGEYKTDKEA